MFKAPRNLDIRKVLIAPIYKKIDEESIYFFLNSVRYEQTFKFIAIYPHEYYSFFYNLSEGRNDIIYPIGYSKDEKYVINPKKCKPLLDYLEIVKYKYDKVKKIGYKELLYLIEPITYMQKYLMEKNKQTVNTIQGDPNAIVTASVYKQNKLFEDCVLEEHKYFAIDLKTGIPISYGFINNNIPYIIKDEIKKCQEENKSLTKSLFGKLC